MRTYIPISADASLYEARPNQNTGLDEILEIGKFTPSTSVKSVLTVPESSLSGHPSESRYTLKLFLANAQRLRRPQQLQVNPVVSSWEEGAGYLYQTAVSDPGGVTWETAPETGSLIVTASIHTYPIQDVSVDITDIISAYQRQEFLWYGIQVQFTPSDLDVTNEGILKVFSSNTHTIYPPSIEVAYYEQQFVTGSLSLAPGNAALITATNLQSSYVRGEKGIVRLLVRDRFPHKNFDTKLRYTNKYYLPQTTYYRIVEASTGRRLHDFDEFSMVECDENGSYLWLDTSWLNENYTYAIELKMVEGQFTYYRKLDTHFTIRRNGL
jgi:hypothetical protein